MLRLLLIIGGSLFLLAGAGCDNAPAPAQQGQDAPANQPASKTVLNHGPENAKPAGVAAPPTVDGYEIVQTYPHDCQAFTQGLEIRDGVLYEGTGLNGSSTLRRVKLESGAVEQRVAISNAYFGEGITVLKDKIYQLTWQSQQGFVYDRATFKKTGEFRYEGEGWGLANDGQSLIMSDGVTNRLRFLNPATFALEKTVTVNDERGRPLLNLNELEYVKGEIYANIWQTDRIARLDPQTGRLLGWLDLTGLSQQLGLARSPCQAPDVLNGIAYDEAQDRLFVTGKLWPRLFEIRLKKKG
jgi:glutamine cyclotransferase